MSSFLMLVLLKRLMINSMEDLSMEDPLDLIALLKERDQLEARVDSVAKVDLEVKVDTVVEDSKTTEVLEIKETQEWT